MVAKPQEHMNKSAERGRKKGGNAMGGVEQNWILFTPQVSLLPENVIGLTHGVAVGSLA